ncbi:hypothetical protein PHISCL_04158 [Aspergillus sclerotialis]|uniref:Uncharacterized protein n=1 Tax=Aspergillus sclerotialis TaxID=2070753 RepID=A0A3A2ZJV6_9EURO|nr:hypothetical protein PHISCL_04158 [Aspergillus sclerotialis]
MPPKRASSASRDNPSTSSKKSKKGIPTPLHRSKRSMGAYPEKAYSFVCVCRLPYKYNNEDEESSDDGEESDKSDESINDKSDSRGQCGKSCVCFKPAAEHPEHALIVTKAGFIGYRNQLIHLQLRPAQEGVIQVIQNLFLDFVEAESDGRKQLDDSDGLYELSRMTGRMFLTILAKLEKEDLLKPDSDITNIAVVMALYIKVARLLQKNG